MKKSKLLNTKDFIKKSKALLKELGIPKYDYSLCNYSHIYSPVTLICKEHGKFDILPSLHLYDRCICPKCSIISSGEYQIAEQLKKYKIKFKTQQSFPNLIGVGGALLRYDFGIYVKSKLVCLLEYNGSQHYTACDFFGGIDGLTYVKKHDKIKRKFAKLNNIPLKVIRYDDDLKVELEVIINELKLKSFESVRMVKNLIMQNI
jgi:hypothetical protein